MNATRFFPLALMLLMPVLNFAAPADSPRERSSLDAHWRFFKGDAPEGGTNLSYTAIRGWILPTGNPFSTNAPAARPEGQPGGDISFARPAFDDSQWRMLNLPHDWGIEGPFDQVLPGGTGRLPWAGVAWYRKALDIPATDAGKKIYLDVDGAMSYSTVWLNGKCVGGWPYGYASWRVDLTPFVNFGGVNVLAIRLDNPPDSSRWYPGGGLYRNVWLVKTAPAHVAHWGTYVTTPEVSAQAATVKIRVDVDNDSDAAAPVSVKNEIFELKANGGKGRVVGSFTDDGLSIGARGLLKLASIIQIADPKLWSLEKPQRYVVVTSILQDGKTVDSYETPFGVRTIEFTATNGFLLNGRRVPINGVCDHHDLGALGAAINLRALERQIEILKAMGCNAIRTSHNPPAPELLDLCDRMGMLVMDESFDCWEARKSPNDYHLIFDAWHERDWRAELRRDRNHPSIVLWSIGNEVGEQNSRNKLWIGAELTAIAHQEDPTRPTTSANNQVSAGFNGFQTNMDVFGYNYQFASYGRFHMANPSEPLFGSETASTVSSRGEFFFPVSTNKVSGRVNHQVSDYGLYTANWANTPDWEFAALGKNPFVAGEFVWTGFDYLGEPTPYGTRNDPSRSSYFGIIDLAGFPKERYYIYQAHWRPDFPMAHILPHWNWPERTNQVTPVHVFTSGDSAELFLNGKSLGRKTKGPFEYRLVWDDVKYQPGTLKVVAYKNGKRWATDMVTTAGPAAKLTMQADRANIAADGQDLSFITVTVADKNGVLVPRSKNHIKFEVEGAGELVGTDNGDATSFESFLAPEHSAYNGLALVIVRTKAGQPGTFTVKAEADGLKAGTVRVASK